MALNTNSAKIEITAEDKTRQAFESIKRGLASIGGSYGSLSSMLSGGAFTLMVRNAIDAADALHDLSLRTGIAVEQLGAWKLVTEQTGTNLDALAKGIGAASRYLVEHNDNLKKLGINANTGQEVILQLAGVFEKLPAEDPLKDWLGAQILKKQYGELMPLLAEGEAGLRKMLETGKELNPVTTELANKADLFNDKLAELQLQGGGIAYLFAGPLMDSFTSLLQRIQDITKETDRLKQLYETLKLVAELAAKPFMGPLGYFMGDAEASGKQTASGKIKYSGGMTTAQTQAAITSMIGVGKGRAKAAQDWYADLLKQQSEMDFKQIEAAADYRNKQIKESADWYADLEQQQAEMDLKDIEAIADYRNKLLLDTAKAQEEQEAARLKQAIEDQDYLTDQTMKAIEKQQAEWQKMTDDINRMLGDALMNAFDAGKGWGKSFIETLQNMFNTLVLRPIISAIVSPVGGAISAGMTGLLGSGSALASGGATGGGGFGSLLSGAQSLWSTFSGGTSAMMEGFASSTMGAALGLSSLEGAAAQTAMSMGMMADTMGTLTSAGSALVSAAPAIGLGVAAIGLLAGGGLGGLFGGGHVMRPKAYANTTVSADSVTTLNSRTVDGADASWAIKPGMALGAYLQAVTKQLSGEIANGFIVGTKYMKKYNSLEITVGKSITKTNSDLMFDMGAEGAGDNAAALTFITAVKKNLIAVDGYLGNLIRNSDAYNTTAASVVQNIIALKGLHDSLDSMPPVFGRIQKYIEAMVNVSSNGGLEGLTALKKSTQTFYSLFYSDAEKQADLSKLLHDQFTALNIAMPQTRDGFKALVESSTGMLRFTSLVNLAPAMDEYYKALEAQADATDAAADAAKNMAKQLAGLNLNEDSFATLVGYTRAQRYVENGITVDQALAAGDSLMARMSDPQANQAALLSEVRQLRVEMQAAQLALAQNTQDTAKILRRWNGDGMPEVRTVT